MSSCEGCECESDTGVRDATVRVSNTGVRDVSVSESVMQVRGM